MKQQDSPFINLSAYSTGEDCLHVIIDTPKGSRNKFKFDEASGLFKLGGVLAAGMVFPFDFGYVPSTRAGDGDPLDVLMLMDEPAFAGCLVNARLIGVIEAEQTEEGETERNDRLIAVAADSRNHKEIHSLDDISANLLDEIEHFFVSYNAAKGKEFKPTNRADSARARQIVQEGMDLFGNARGKARRKKVSRKRK